MKELIQLSHQPASGADSYLPAVGMDSEQVGDPGMGQRHRPDQ